jgi:hypothetical protein
VLPEGLAWPPKKDDLERLYLVEKLSAAKIAERYGLIGRYKTPKVAESTVLYHLKKNGIARRDPAEHDRKVTEKMEDEWVRRYNSGESLKQIAADTVDPVTVWNHLKSKGLVLRDRVEAQIQAVTKYKRKRFSGDEVERAYLMGLRYGDLHVVRHGRAIRTRVSTTHPALADLFESLFSPYGYVHRYPRGARFTGYEWSLECDLDPSFAFLLQPLSLNELEALPRSEFLAFLAGFFDAEGTVYLHRKRFGFGFEVTISNTNRTLLELFSLRLCAMDFHPKIDSRIQNPARLGSFNEGTIFRLSLYRKQEVNMLLGLLPLRHGEKTEKARIAIEYTLGKADRRVSLKAWAQLAEEIRIGRDRFVEKARKAREGDSYSEP